MSSAHPQDNPLALNGVLLVDKPVGITSHDVVDEVRRVLSTRRVGHAGTLDPAAEGLLVLLVGEATKIAEYLQSSDKQYEGVMRLGVVSDTYDAQGAVEPGPGGRFPDIAALQDLADEMTGDLAQVPPPYSAKKVAGKKLYEYARAGKQVAVDARSVVVHDFEILEAEGDRVEFGIECSSGTYVRSIVHDLGQRAGCGAIMVELRRTVSGHFEVEEAIGLEDLKVLAGNEEALRARIIPIRRALPEMPAGWLLSGAEDWLRRGQAIPSSLVEVEEGKRPAKGATVVLCRLSGDAVALARVDPAPISPPPRAFAGAPAPWFQPIKLFDSTTE